MAKTILFVYGTLKRGFRNHHYLRGQRFLRDARTLPRYRLYSRGRYPALVTAEPGVAVCGELWEVEDEALGRIDRLEEVPVLFRRERIAVAGPPGPVAGYLYNGDVAGLADCGDAWLAGRGRVAN